MFCPKCGTQNADTNKYCRNCRENLKVVSLAMKRRLPVVLASKVDEVLDRKSERFRRDSIYNALAGASCLSIGLIGRSGFEFWYLILLSCLGFGTSLWEYLVYRRSLS